MKSAEKKQNDLKDIKKVTIPQDLTPAEKKEEYLRQVGSSIHHRVGDVEVECAYGDIDLEKMLADLICG